MTKNLTAFLRPHSCLIKWQDVTWAWGPGFYLFLQLIIPLPLNTNKLSTDALFCTWSGQLLARNKFVFNVLTMVCWFEVVIISSWLQFQNRSNSLPPQPKAPKTFLRDKFLQCITSGFAWKQRSSLYHFFIFSQLRCPNEHSAEQYSNSRRGWHILYEQAASFHYPLDFSGDTDSAVLVN